MSFLRALGAAKVDIEIQIGLCWAINSCTCDDKDSGIVVGQSAVCGNHAAPRALVDKAFKGLFGTQEFHRNHTGISQESVQFHRKNAGMGKKSRIPNRPSVELVSGHSSLTKHTFVLANTLMNYWRAISRVQIPELS